MTESHRKAVEALREADMLSDMTEEELPEVLVSSIEGIDGAVAELHVHPDGIVTAQIRIPGK